MIFSTPQGCQPYEIPACEHHSNGTRPPCGGDPKTPKCQKKCQSSFKASYKDDLHYGNYSLEMHQSLVEFFLPIMKSLFEYLLIILIILLLLLVRYSKYTTSYHVSGEKSYSIDGNEDKIKQEIYRNGPVEAAFSVYADFVTYKSGMRIIP